MSDSAPVQFFDESTQLNLSEIFELVERTSRNLKRVQRQTVREAGLTPPQYRVLQLLWEQDERPFKDLADALLCSRATVTGIIDTLERKGLVRREANPADRRSLLATLTDAGRGLQHETPSLEHIYNQCCSGLSTWEFQQLGLLLHKLNESLNDGELR